jgi:hypothetical protein
MSQQTTLCIVLIVPLASAVVAAAVPTVILFRKLRQPMGPPSWSFTTSCASNITLVGGVLVFAAAIALIKPEDPRPLLMHDRCVVFSILFPLIAGIAPLVYNRVARLGNANPGIRVQGWVGTFIFASMFTMWGSLGHLLLQIFLVRDISLVAKIGQAPSCVLGTMLALLWIGLIFYAVRSILVAVKSSAAAIADDGERAGWAVL